MQLRTSILVSLTALFALALAHDSDYMVVPGGRLHHRNCVHAIPSASFSLDENVDGSFKITTVEGQIITIARCQEDPQPFHGPAWRAWTQYQNAARISSLYGEWQVPPAPPKNDGQILYVSSTQSFFSQILQVSTNDVIFGNNVYNANGTWAITATSKSSGKSTGFTHKPPLYNDYTWAYQVLEAYTISNCVADYPKTNKIFFNNISVKVNGKSVTPKWQVQTKDTACKENAQVESPTQTSISWN